MIIYSWNMLFRNKSLDEAFAFISGADFDVMCLQEVPEAFLERLRALPYHLVTAVDNKRLTPPLGNVYLVLLSRHPVKSHGTFDFPDYWPILPLRTRLFVRLMRPFGWARIRGRQGLYADIEAPQGVVRIFDLHIINGTIEKRLGEFERAMQYHDAALPTVVCGDLNTIGSPRVALINWLHGGSFSEVFGYPRERLAIERHFIELGFENIFRGRSTHSFAESQFDHILVSKHFPIAAAEIVRECYGSDHHPLRVVLN